MLNAFSDLLCSKLCWHNQLVPTYRHVLHYSTLCVAIVHSVYDVHYILLWCASHSCMHSIPSNQVLAIIIMVLQCVWRP